MQTLTELTLPELVKTIRAGVKQYFDENKCLTLEDVRIAVKEELNSVKQDIGLRLIGGGMVLVDGSPGSKGNPFFNTFNKLNEAYKKDGEREEASRTTAKASLEETMEYNNKMGIPSRNISGVNHLVLKKLKENPDWVITREIEGLVSVGSSVHYWLMKHGIKYKDILKGYRFYSKSEILKASKKELSDERL